MRGNEGSLAEFGNIPESLFGQMTYITYDVLLVHLAGEILDTDLGDLFHRIPGPHPFEDAFVEIAGDVLQSHTGQADAPSGSWDEEVYLSADGTLTDAVLLDTFRYTAGLAASAAILYDWGEWD